ncbi:pentatricopeptide repeat-containing protein At3g49170, chloroplastic-like [Manihot esculenta]|uniref:pentatricopeptide repeat-containing protein At3g49170, chloroplastic-like n=1 Tax=Manihot esculenta TaxID=3983 RepID=UPI000B5D42AB|nr:pentatricopeptide repeat-containing protein At3g49170, chloroplastic-like [Manihot esculenta]
MISLSLPFPAKLPVPHVKPSNQPSRQNLPPSSMSVNHCNSRFHSLKDRLARHLHAGHVTARELGLASVNCVGNSLISMYARCGNMENARKAFNILFDENLISYNTIVNAYVNSLNSEEAFKFFNEIEDTGTQVDAFTFASLLSGASSIGTIGKGEQIHACILKSGFKSNLHISNALISMYA